MVYFSCVCRARHLLSPRHPRSASPRGWCLTPRHCPEATAAAFRPSAAAACPKPPVPRPRRETTPSRTPPPAAPTSCFDGRTRPHLRIASTRETIPGDPCRFPRACPSSPASTRRRFRPNPTRYESRTTFPGQDPFPEKSRSCNGAFEREVKPFAHLTSVSLVKKRIIFVIY